MKTEKYYLVLAVITGILCAPCLGDVELPVSGDEDVLIGKANQALEGTEKLYVIVEPSDARPSKDGLVWKELQEKVEQKLEKVGIEIAPGIYLGQGLREHEIPELRVQMELLKFTKSQVYVFRTQTSFATKVHLEKQGLYFKAEVWKVAPAMRAVPVRRMPVAVTSIILGQVDAFIAAWLAANPKDAQLPDADDIDAVSLAASTKLAEPVAKPPAAKYEYVASKNSKVFHKVGCTFAERIKLENRVSYNDRNEAIKAGKRPCKRCKP